MAGGKLISTGIEFPDATTQTSSGVKKTGDTMTGNLNLGDSIKAQFGASNDLQIYHDGTNSIIKENTGAGSLHIQADFFRVQDITGTETKILAQDNGYVKLYHNNAEKLATTSTGIDVTGRADVIDTSGNNTSQLRLTDSTNTTSTYLGQFSDGTRLTNNATYASGWSADDALVGVTQLELASDYITLGTAAAGASSATERMRIDSSGNVGIGTSSPNAKLAVDGNVNASMLIFRNNQSTPTADAAIFRPANNSVAISTLNTERMRIDSSGNLLVGCTTSIPAGLSQNVTGIAMQSDGQLQASADGQFALALNRKTSDGDLVQFRKDGTTVGSIGAATGDMYLGTYDTGLYFQNSLNIIKPFDTGTLSDRDNAIDLGGSVARFDDIYATNGTIQTSDRNEKQDIEELTEAEQRVAIACKGLMRKYRWKDAVEKKGDDARIHFGIIAQDLQDAFEAEGLDAHRYAMFISTTWWETQTEVPAVEAVEEQEATYDDDGNELTPYVEGVEAKEAYTRTDTFDTLEEAPEGATERTRLGVRYPELLAFIISAL